MLEQVLPFLMVVHGLIHLVGFSKAFITYNGGEMTTGISRPSGLLWLVVAMVFTGAGFMMFMNNQSWWVFALGANFLSQLLISKVWSDAWPGTIANVIILAGILILK